MESWRPVVGYEGFYEVSDEGRVRSVRRNLIMSPGTLGPGYQIVGLSVKGRQRKSFLVHRLVMIAFGSPPPSDEHQCAHGDGDPKNNRFSNLRWATVIENSNDKFKHGTTRKGMTSTRALATPAQVVAIRSFPTIQGWRKIIERELFDGSSIIEPIVRGFSYKTVRDSDHIQTPDFQAELDRLYETLYHTHWHERSLKGKPVTR